MSNHVETTVTAAGLTPQRRFYHPQLGRCLVIAIAPRDRATAPVACTVIKLADSSRHQLRLSPASRFGVA